MTQPTAAEQELGKRLTQIIDYVRDCSRRVALGEVMDLDGLDKNVVDLCNDVGDLPEEQAKAMEKQMAGLIKDLEELATNMRNMARKMDAEEQAEKAKGKKG